MAVKCVEGPFVFRLNENSTGPHLLVQVLVWSVRKLCVGFVRSSKSQQTTLGEVRDGARRIELADLVVLLRGNSNVAH